MDIIFFGTSEFAVPALKKIIASNHRLLAVVTQPDREKGRSRRPGAPPVKSALEGSAVPVLQPEDASGADTVEALKGYNTEVFVVVSFGQILREALLEAPKKFCVNLHASLLPKYRGAAPVNRAIMNGDRVTGVTTMRMDEGMDTGETILKKRVDILDTDTAETLNERLSRVGADLLLETLDLIASGKAKFTKQDGGAASYANKLRKIDGLIDWTMAARDIHNRVRGLMPWPGAYTHWSGKLVKIWDSEFSEEGSNKEEVGTIGYIKTNSIGVITGRGCLIIKELQLEGKRRLGVGEFLRGYKLKAGDVFK